MLFWIFFSWYLDLVRHATNVFKGAELIAPAEERFHKLFIVSVCDAIEDDVCDELASSFGMPTELARQSLLEDYFGINQHADYARDWYTFYQFDYEMYTLGLIS